MAEKELKVPAVLNAEHLASSSLDEFSLLTYLSFFTQTPDGPGYKATLGWAQSMIGNRIKKPTNLSVLLTLSIMI